MKLMTEQDAANTRKKLRLLEQMYEESAGEEGDELQQLEMDSLARLINQLKEELAAFKAHHTAGTAA